MDGRRGRREKVPRPREARRGAVEDVGELRDVRLAALEQHADARGGVFAGRREPRGRGEQRREGLLHRGRDLELEAAPPPLGAEEEARALGSGGGGGGRGGRGAAAAFGVVFRGGGGSDGGGRGDQVPVDPLLRLDNPRGVDQGPRVRAAELSECAHAAPEPVLEQPRGRADPRDVRRERLERGREGRGRGGGSFLGPRGPRRGAFERPRRGGGRPFEARDALVGLCEAQGRRSGVERGSSCGGVVAAAVADAEHRLGPRRLLWQRGDGPRAS